MMLSLQTISTALLLLLILYVSYSRLRAFLVGPGPLPAGAASAQALPKPARARNWLPFGIDAVYKQLRAMQAHTALEMTQSRFTRAAPLTTIESGAFGTTVFSTIEPENIKTILATRFTDYSVGRPRKKTLIPVVGQGIFTSDPGEGWEESRHLLKPCFGRAGIDEFCRYDDDGEPGLFERHVRHLIDAIDAIQGKSDAGEVDLQPLFYAASLDIATEFLFGHTTGCLGQLARRARGELSGEKANEQKTEAEKFVESLVYLQDNLEGDLDSEDNKSNAFTRAFALAKIFLPNSKAKQHVKVLHSFVDGIIEQALKERAANKDEATTEKRRYIFLDEIVAQTSDVVKIRAELLNILLAGRDTTAALLSNVWFELARRPDIFASLRDELHTAGFLPTGTDFSFTSLKSLKYLHAIMNESLRLYPVLPENSREATHNTLLSSGGGPDGKSPVLIRKGDMVHWSLYTMHRRRDIYGEDAEEYRPERWLGPTHSHDNAASTGEARGLKVGWEYLPFNGGPRICIGQQFALTEAAYLTVRLVQEFDAGIESRDPLPWREKFSMTCSGLGGAKVVLKRRDTDTYL